MKLKEIVIHNVGIYSGRHVISLDSEKRGRPIVLVGALNGCGKTTILEALKLGLYGKLAKTARRGGDSYETYLKKLTNKNVGPSVGAGIEIDFVNTNSTRLENIRIVRT